MDIPSYILSLQKGPSTFYEENYIDPNGVEITFPGKKRNLIVIFVESLETGFLIRNNGGAFSERLMPEIEDLMRDNINFSMDSGLGGAHELYGTEWTIAGIVSQYSGVPMAVSFLNQIDWNNYGMLGDDFLPGASGVGDILHKAGYKNYFILGSDIEFGGRDKYFKTHKDTIIYDYNYFIENNYIPKDYNVWWGFEDRKLYAFSKEKLLEIAQDAPFFATILTADTHPVGGYLDAGALKIFDSQYMDVVFDTSRQLSDFLEWLKEQEFYENTTVAVLGDHLHHDSSVFPRDYQIHSLSSKYDSSYRGGLDNKYKRFPVNIFINSLLSEEHTKNRIFSHFDVFPALIDSVGGVYNAKGLALGRSMNKGEATLLEELELDYVNDVLQRRSNYYDRLWQKKTE
jgi:phosphoglycerol transferase